MLRFPQLVLMVAGVACSSPQAPTSPVRDRRDFARAMAQVQPGMEADEVLRILGKPEDIRTREDLGDRLYSSTPEVWCWGTSGHMTSATLGSIFIEGRRKVYAVSGGRGEPPDPSVIGEDELRRLMNVMDRAPSYQNWGFYEARRLIEVVNALQPLGKKKAVAAMKEYLRVTPFLFDADGRDGLFLAVRVLFDVPAGSSPMPRMKVGFSREEPQDPKIFPRFPILLAADIPLLLAKGYSGGGAPESVVDHLAAVEKHGAWRTAPLVPSARPHEALESLERSLAALDPGEKQCPDPGFTVLQLLNLLRTVYRSAPETAPPPIRDLIPQLRKLTLKWDPAGNRYTFEDGSVLPD